MKLTILIACLSLVQVSASIKSYGQNVSLKSEGQTLRDVFKSLEAQSNYRFFYNDAFTDLDKTIICSVSDRPIKEVLDKIFTGLKVYYKVLDNNLVVIAPTTEIQQQQVTGRVTDIKTGEPMPGVNVTIKGTTKGVVTDTDGKYSITVSGSEDVLIFSFVGYLTEEAVIGDKRSIDILLTEDIQKLEAVVVIGYGQMKKSDLTASVTSIKSETINKIAATNVLQTLQGRAAGLSVTSYGGEPGSGATVRIRGVGTVNSTNPLYIIDGIRGNLSSINPSDIEAIEVLKDGAAAAIYGTEGANGVILVKTKDGQKGKMKVEISSYYGKEIQTNRLELANSEQYIKIISQMYQNAGQALPAYTSQPIKYDTDWIKEITRNAPVKYSNVNMSGGNESVDYFLSGSLSDETGTMIGSAYNKANLRAKINFSNSKWFKMGSNISYTYSKLDTLTIWMRRAYEVIPLIPVYDAAQPSGFGVADEKSGMLESNNPVALSHFNNFDKLAHNIVTNLYSETKFSDALSFRIEGGLDNVFGYDYSHHPAYFINSKEPVNYPGVSETRSLTTEWNLHGYFTYKKKFNNHDISFMAGYSRRKWEYKYTSGTINGYKMVYSVDAGGNLKVDQIPTGFLDQNFNTLDAGMDGIANVAGTRRAYTQASLISRLNYSFADKYLLQVTFRRDGSSKFGIDSRYGNFPSIALGWKLSNEEFMKGISAIRNLKLRGSWGKLGNELGLSAYYHLPLMRSSTREFLSYSRGDGETVWNGTISRTMENRKFRWETTTSRNIGVDYALFGGKINGAINIYNNLTTDMLLPKTVPSSSGLETPIVNIGELSNKGIELELNYTREIGAFAYTVGATFTTVKNEVLKLGEDNGSIFGDALNYTEHYPTQTRIGYPVGSFFLYQNGGIFQSQKEIDDYNASGHDAEGNNVPYQPNAKPGDLKFLDVDGRDTTGRYTGKPDGKLDDADMVYSGSGIPKYEYSIYFDLAYKGFDFSIFFTGASGYKLYNGNRFLFESMRSSRNMLSVCENAWTPQNTNTDIPRPVLGDPNENARPSTRFLEKGNYLRLKNIQLGYTLPNSLLSKMKLSKIRVYVSGQNILTFTNYSGVDPEIGRRGAYNNGVDMNLYPIYKTYLIGIQVNL